MPLVVIVVVKPHESILLLCAEYLIHRFMIHHEPWVEHPRMPHILEEKHVGDESVQSVPYPDAVLVVESSETVAHLDLRVHLLLECVETIIHFQEEMLLDIVNMNAEESFQYSVVDEGSCMQFPSEGQSISCNFLLTEWQPR